MNKIADKIIAFLPTESIEPGALEQIVHKFDAVINVKGD
jgi:hypothetical protein